jgi:hypothetical protein
MYNSKSLFVDNPVPRGQRRTFLNIPQMERQGADIQSKVEKFTFEFWWYDIIVCKIWPYTCHVKIDTWRCEAGDLQIGNEAI